ncbi:uncharacterized protein LOC128882944 [Hylaeus volcanicus]|uniref:uncharacterized protein LOC128882944 n=1 Tax=Hylaeus volcanicus TaxID=313075 RepID=UPI0023B7E8E2|nr:uncharacterized protein LOC128882944 [Hylaeus volcanicus]
MKHLQKYKLTMFLTILYFLIAKTTGQSIGMPYFYAQEGKEKCFSAEVRTGMTVGITYINYNNTGVECSVTLRDFKNKPLYIREVNLAKPQGKITYISKENGELKICVYCSHLPWHTIFMRKWTISIDTGELSTKSNNLVDHQYLKTVEDTLEALHYQVDSIRAENIYQQKQEEKYRAIYAKVNSHIILFSALEVIIMATVTLFAITNLSRYFHAQKLF